MGIDAKQEMVKDFTDSALLKSDQKGSLGSTNLFLNSKNAFHKVSKACNGRSDSNLTLSKVNNASSSSSFVGGRYSLGTNDYDYQTFKREKTYLIKSSRMSPSMSQVRLIRELAPAPGSSSVTARPTPPTPDPESQPAKGKENSKAAGKKTAVD